MADHDNNRTPMLPDEVREAVEYVDQIFDDADNGEWAAIKAHLLAREAELTELRREMDDYNAIESALEDAVATSNKHRDRAERAEATLHEIRDSTHKSALMLRAMADRRITAHLSENSRG